MIQLTVQDALHVSRRTIGDDVMVRDVGLLATARLEERCNSSNVW